MKKNITPAKTAPAEAAAIAANINYDDIFNGCGGLEYKSNGDGTCTVTSKGDNLNPELEIPERSPNGDIVVAIGDEAFASYDNFDWVTIPKTIKYIGEYAFDSSYLCGVTIEEGGDNVEIGRCAFSNCDYLEEVNLPEGVVSIGDYAFDGCGSLRDLKLPSTLTTIGKDALNFCGK